jgi:hypothetical protein
VPVLWDAWTPDVSIDVKGCPSITIEKAVRDTVIDFCERTHLIQRTVGPLDVTAGAGEKTSFGTSIAATEHVLAIKAAWIDGKSVEIYGPADAAADFPDWQTALGTPEYLVMERPNAYYVVPALADPMVGALRMRVAVGLLETATGCDDRIRRDYRDAITQGAKARLFAIADKPWTNLPLAGVMQASYMGAVSSATIVAIRTPARRPLATTPHFF